MRTPTPLSDLYAWHRAAMAGLNPQITHEPHVGWFVRRLVKGGPIVPARIWLQQDIDPVTKELAGDERLRCEVAGKERNAEQQWTYLADAPISQAEYDYRVADAAWCATHAPGSPLAVPTVAVTSRNIPPLF